MKIDSFYQCLTYVRSVSQEVDGGSLSEWLLPLVGVVVGFVLSTLASLFSAYWKEGRIKKSILAEVSLVKSQAEKTFKATIEMMYEVNKLPPDATPYQPSATLSIFLFQQLFSGVAHRFKATQIEQFQYLQAHVKTVNDKVAWLTDSQRARGAEFWDYSYKVPRQGFFMPGEKHDH